MIAAIAQANGGRRTRSTAPPIRPIAETPDGVTLRRDDFEALTELVADAEAAAPAVSDSHFGFFSLATRGRGLFRP